MGRHLSHRKGYAGSFGLVVIADRMKGELYFKFNGSAEEAEKVFTSTACCGLSQPMPTENSVLFTSTELTLLAYGRRWP